MIAQPHMSKMRHRCRNPRCGRKLKEPTDNPREAFCCKGCFTSYYRNRCIVDERPYNRVREDQHTCGSRKCKGELRRHPLRYFGRWLPVPHEALSALRNPIKSGLKTGIKGWRWVRLPSEDDDWQLLNREGRQVARIRQDGNSYWVTRPRCVPEPPLEGLEQAKLRAELMALWAMDPLWQRSPRTKRRAELMAIISRNRALVNLLGGYRFESTPALDQELIKTILQMESRLGEPLPSVPSPPLVPTESPAPMPKAEDPLAIPDFLRRAHQQKPRRSMRHATQQECR
jgi:hypothetical protein